MKTNKWALCLGIMVMFAGLYASAAKADIFFESEDVSTNVPNHANGASIVKNYFTSDAYRTELGDGKVVIMDYNSMKLFMLDPKAKTYREINMAERPKLPGSMGADKQKMLDNALAEPSQVQVVPTDETKTIEGYKCRKYNVKLAMSEGEYWVSKDVKGLQELKTLSAKMASAMKNNPMYKQPGFAELSEKLDGFPVYTVRHIMGGTIQATLKNIEQKSLDPALFKVPAEYTLVQKAHP